MLEIAVRHTREENYAHTYDWKKPYDGSIFDMARWAGGLVRHDPEDLAQAIMDMYLQLSPVKVYTKK